LDARLPRIDDGDRRDVIDDSIHERPRGTRRFHREATLRVASRQQRRNPGIRRWPSLLPRSLAGAIYRADLKKRLVQIDPDVGWLHGRPPLSSGAMSFCHEHATSFEGGRPFHPTTKTGKD